jgi:oxygen-independent coproporphyrinogen-3 oxidase
VTAPHLYVHVPFCARKCPYCDFNSHAGRDGEVDAYLDAVLLEADAAARELRPRTVFVGGGTPTHPSAAQLDRFLGRLLETVGAPGAAGVSEFTVEANPGTLTAEKVAALVRHGVDRLSVGAQSFSDERLKVLGRIHGAEETERSVEAARAGGVRRLSLDLILATPGQSLAEQRADLARAVALAPDHVSTYVLTFEEGTAFTRALEQGRLAPPDEERDLAHLSLACETLSAAGYRRYEVSNHAMPGEESLHNLAYWRNAEWLGLGAGAHSHVAGRRWKNVDDPAEYVARVRADRSARAWTESVSPRAALFESLMMGLRLVDGIDLAALALRHGVDPRAEHADAIARHADAGLLVVEGDRLRCTARGLDLLQRVLLDFVPDPDDAVVAS